ncbi:MAG: ATP-binding cassette domain-containing protein, partial [Acidimicrobiia bacterium]
RERGEEKLLVCRDVDVIYDGAQVLFGVDFDVNAGETVALLGTNGAGKSTLLKAVCGLHMVDNGAVFFEGDDVTATPPHELAQRGMVYVPGGRAVFPGLTVEENLRTATWSSDDLVDERIAVVLDFFPRLRERLAQPAGTLSGGEQQMVALSQAFLMRPKLLLIDELSLGLAPAVVEQLLEILRAIRDQGTTLVLVEQSLNVAATIAERGVFMDKGRIEFDGPIDDLVRRPDLVRSIFMGGAAAGASVGRRVKRAEDETQVALGCQDVAVGFGGLQALDGVTFQVAAGEIVGIMGPNGAGKTTLFDVLSGYLHPDRGKVILGDRDVTRLPPYARAKLGLGRSFQSAQLFGALTVRETIAVALEKRAPKNPLAAAFWAPGQRQREQRLRERVDGYIELLGLGDHADKFIRELSTGSRRAVDVACAMANEPAVLLLDEPSSGLAQAEIEALGPTLARLSRETGCSLVVIEHDLPLLTSLSDRLVAMELGAVLADGPPELVTRDPRVLTSYLNASAAVLQRSGSRLAAVLDALGAPPSDEQPEGS